MSPGGVRSRQYFRFSWSHTAALHRWLVRRYNRVMQMVPFGLKYGWGLRRRRRRVPYSLLDSRSAVAVQVGAPRDTLHAGRSRGMYFALLAGTSVIIEPEPRSAQEFERLVRSRALHGAHVVNAAAWSTESQLYLRTDPAHPATSFTEGTVGYPDSELERFLTVAVAARPLDRILADLSIGRVDVLSLTTNGGELEMLLGADATLERTTFVCLRHGCDDGAAYLVSRGFLPYSHDDRGMTYARKAGTAQS